MISRKKVNKKKEKSLFNKIIEMIKINGEKKKLLNEL